MRTDLVVEVFEAPFGDQALVEFSLTISIFAVIQLS